MSIKYKLKEKIRVKKRARLLEIQECISTWPELQRSTAPSLSEDNWQFGPVVKGPVQRIWLYVHHLDGNCALTGCGYNTDSSIRNEC